MAKKNKEPEVVNLEGSASKIRNQDDINLEIEVNEELTKRREDIAKVWMKNHEVSNRAQSLNQGKTMIEDSGSTNGSKFVDATQQVNYENEDSENNASEEEEVASENSANDDDQAVLQQDI